MRRVMIIFGIPFLVAPILSLGTTLTENVWLATFGLLISSIIVIANISIVATKSPAWDETFVSDEDEAIKIKARFGLLLLLPFVMVISAIITLSLLKWVAGIEVGMNGLPFTGNPIYPWDEGNGWFIYNLNVNLAWFYVWSYPLITLPLTSFPMFSQEKIGLAIFVAVIVSIVGTVLCLVLSFFIGMDNFIGAFLNTMGVAAMWVLIPGTVIGLVALICSALGNSEDSETTPSTARNRGSRNVTVIHVNQQGNPNYPMNNTGTPYGQTTQQTLAQEHEDLRAEGLYDTMQELDEHDERLAELEERHRNQ